MYSVGAVDTDDTTYKARVSPKHYRATGFGALAALDAISINDRSAVLRNQLPEPFDLMDHAGNFSLSLWLGLGASRLAGALVTKLDTTPKVMKTITVGLGTGVVALANIVAENKWGSGFLGLSQTPDPVDALYGIGAGAFAASFVDIEPVK